MAYRPEWVRLIRTLAPRYGIDPQAALAVASAEGLSGGAGDQGTSFGPWQLHVGGALPSGKGRAWAESAAGIEYALRQMSSARGLRGKAAVAAIVRDFERPADPTGEIARAVGALGQFAGGGAGALPSPANTMTATAPMAAPRAIPTHVLNEVNRSLAGQTTTMPTMSTGGAIPGHVLDAVNQHLLKPLSLPKFVGRAAAPATATMPMTPTAPKATGTVPVPAPTGGSEFSTVDAEGAPDASGTHHHAAYDWMLGGNAPVPALLAGTVIEAKLSRGSSGQIYGGTVKILTADGRVLVFRHVAPNVRVGQRVNAGQPVARVVRWQDNPGSSHAHTEIWKTRAGGYRFENMVDPLGLIQSEAR